MNINISAGRKLLKNKGNNTKGASLERMVSDETKEGSVEAYMNRDIPAGVILLRDF